MTGNFPGLRFRIVPKSEIIAGLLLQFRAVQSIHGTDVHAQTTVIAERLFHFVRLKFLFRQNRTQPDHTAKFRRYQQRVSSYGSQPCRLCRMLLGDHRPPSARIFIPLAFVCGNGNANYLIFFHFNAKVKSNGIHLRCNRIPNSRIRNIRRTL